MSLRKTASLTAMLSLILLATTSVTVYLAPHGPRSGQWVRLGLDKHQWKDLHTNLGVLLLMACIVHIVLNIKPIMAYLENKDGKFRLFTLDFNIALLLTAWIVISTLFELPPVSAIQNWQSGRERSAEEASADIDMPTKTNSFPDRPPFRFGRRTLADVCTDYELDQSSVLLSLNDLGIKAKAEWTIKSIAEENSMEPHSLFDTLQQLQAE